MRCGLLKQKVIMKTSEQFPIKMKRPNKHSKPLSGKRLESYHPADLDGQYVIDLNKYIDYLESLLVKKK